MTAFRRLTLATTIATIFVIAIGGFVRASGSGDGCPDWPKCFGRWFPPLQFHAIVEYTHRYAGAVAIGLLLVTAVIGVTRHRSDRRLLIPTLVSAGTIIMQAVLGGIVVAVKDRAKTDPSFADLEGPLITFHIATAMVLVAMLVLVYVRTVRLERTPLPMVDRATRRIATTAAVGLYALILIGAYTRGSHASLAFPDWPLMDGTLLPSLTGNRGIHFAHRFAALLVGALIAWFVVRVLRMRPRPRPLVMLAVGAGVLFTVQVVVGGIQVLTALDSVPVALHVLLSALIWSCLVASVAVTRPLVAAEEQIRIPLVHEPMPAPIAGAQLDLAMAPPRRLVSSSAAYLALTKPRIVVLLLITTVPSMILAAGGMPDPALIAWTMAGGTLAAGAANAINMVIDRDIDAIMSRTRRRPLPSHTVTPERALFFAMVLAAVSFVAMTATVNLLAAILAQSAIAFYVFIYTLVLKRTTPQNIVIGGAAGAVPVLVGWAAVTGTLALPAWLLFTLVFCWTPPHFWALAMRYARDYEAANVPMLPVVAGRERTQRSMARYTVLTVLVGLALWPVADLGVIYGLASTGLGLWFLRDVWRLRGDAGAKAAMTVFKTSIVYLAFVFMAVAADVLARAAVS